MERDRDVERKRHQEKGMRGERDQKDKGTRDSKRKRCHMTEMSKVFFLVPHFSFFPWFARALFTV